MVLKKERTGQKMRFLLLLCSLLALCMLTLQLNVDRWKSFKFLLDKMISSESRYEIEELVKNKERLQKINQLPKTDTETQSRKKNSTNDFVYKMQRYNSSLPKVRGYACAITQDYGGHISMDWRNCGAVSPVKRQGRCDSSYAFAAAGALEGLYFNQHGVLRPLSVQNLVDCSVHFHNHACDGGTVEVALRYVAANWGIDPESVYPYEGRTNRCRFVREKLVFISVGYKSLNDGDERALKLIVKRQPVAARLRVCYYDFFYYQSGVYYDTCPDDARMTISVLIVGYGTYEGERYWLIKNSWGTEWGMEGYMLLARYRGNQCGVASAAVYPYFMY